MTCALIACGDDTTVVVVSRTTPPEDSGDGGLTVIVASGDSSAEWAPLRPAPPRAARAVERTLAPEAAILAPAAGTLGRALAVGMIAWGAGWGILLRRRGIPE